MERKASHEDTEQDAHEQGDEVGFVESVGLVAQFAGETLHGIGRSYHSQTVTHLQTHTWLCEEFDTRAVETGYVDAVEAAGVQTTECLSIDFVGGDEDFLRNHREILLAPIHLDGLSHEGDDGLGVFLRADDEQLVAHV